ncbi:phage minor tail protein L [Paraburkholderia bonniea]|uniref:phage minor tail protein L n=1 Tax=Paraburkholderia bonniea TaxID=2152891 RepID=UPI001291196C|nr:phage minor tail protein L [Paraburkholderia bonniea]WJF92007.1 phage minor tail protein L [Paraburkholderia bonniea]WJF95326.1 phage minor tail protein L [Paraburkholderia bonniea]
MPVKTGIQADVQALEPGAKVRLYELDASGIGGQIARFHAHRTAGPITWQGLVYSPWPVDAEGFQRTSAGTQPSPTLRVGNVDGSISSLCLALGDLVGAKLVRRETLAKYLDAVNFPQGNPSADPAEELRPEAWRIERKSRSDSEVVEFELASPLDFDGEQLPRRQIVPNLCSFQYRSAECGYTGGPVADVNNQPTGDAAKDRCSNALTGCRLRFGANNPLPFGGFPAAGLIRT